MSRVHGADTSRIKREKNIDVELLDYSSNINPNTPLCLDLSFERARESITSYPDIDYYELRCEISKYVSMISSGEFSYRNICVGNGASELISIISSLSKGKIGIFTPTFGEYENVSDIHGKEIVKIPMKNDGDRFLLPDIDDNFKDCMDGVDTLFVCNPNNPDGGVRDIRKIAEYCNEMGIKLIVDETFMEFCDEEYRYTSLSLRLDNVYVLRAFTKFFGVPGIRLGYVVSTDLSGIEKISLSQMPWSVNALAEEFGKMAVNEKKFISESKVFYKGERDIFLREIRAIENIHVYDTDSAFVLIRIDRSDIDSSYLKTVLVDEYSLVIRDCSSFGLGDRYIRVAIKSRDTNNYVSTVLKKVLG